jgi:hypothetical protein
MTPPSFMMPSMASHSSTWLSSMSSTVSPRRTPRVSSHAATWSERRASSSNVRSWCVPSSSTTISAVPSLPRAIGSNQSIAQLNAPSKLGQTKSAAAAGSVRTARRWSRAAR